MLLTIVESLKYLEVLSTIVKPKSTPVETNIYIRVWVHTKCWCCFTNFVNTTCVVASEERRFLKIKLIKTCLRSSISKTHLSGLANVSIKNCLAKSLDYNEVIKEFANAKAR